MCDRQGRRDAVAPQTRTSRTTTTIISDNPAAPFPAATRVLLSLTLLVNAALLASRLASVLARTYPHRRYVTVNGSSLPGTSVMAWEVLGHGVPILALIAV